MHNVRITSLLTAAALAALASPAAAGIVTRVLATTGSGATSGVVAIEPATGVTSTFIAANSGGLSSARGLLVDGSSLLVTSLDTDQVLRFDLATGAYQGVLIADPAHLDGPYSIVRRGDYYYVSGSNSNDVVRYDASGAFVDAFVPPGSGGLVRPFDLELGSDGDLYVTSVGGGSSDILRFDGTTGAFVSRLPHAEEPRALMVAPGGQLWATTAEGVMRYDGVTNALYGFLTGPILGSRTLAIDPDDGHLYVADRATNAILRFDEHTGAPLGTFAGVAFPTDFVFILAPDSDGDGLRDPVDACPHDAANDADGDGRCADADDCPLVANPFQLDGDGDGAGDACDVCPADPDDDADGDGVCGDVDDCAGAFDPLQLDVDGDAQGDACDVCPLDAANDADGDGFCADVDVCDFIPGAQTDLDGDGQGDACDVCPLDAANDADGDGLCADADDCPSTANPDQADSDGDLAGDACDTDDDGDGVADAGDDCPLFYDPEQRDADHDGTGDACDVDDDGDGVLDANDACPATPAGATVDATGCAIADLCPCAHPVASASWKNHGAYVSCVSRAAGSSVTAGVIGQSTADAIISAAAQSTCGARR